MTSKPRNRVVVFRLSQEEYRSLQDACQRAEGRNLSEFTRCEVLEYLNARTLDGQFASRFATLEEQIMAIRLKLDRLLEGAIHAESKQ